jgi:hypothetical protein
MLLPLLVLRIREMLVMRSVLKTDVGAWAKMVQKKIFFLVGETGAGRMYFLKLFRLLLK